MDGRPLWTDCDEPGDYVVHNVLSPRDLVFRPGNIDETVPHVTLNNMSESCTTQSPKFTIIICVFLTITVVQLILISEYP